MTENWPGRGFYRGNKQAMVADAMRFGGILLAADPLRASAPAAPSALDDAAPTELPTPQQMGFTGNTCSNCGGSRMMVAGHCEVCSDCGTTTGCS